MTERSLPSNPDLQPSAASANGAPKPLLVALSFLGGFQIMALEVCGFRILQMNLGSSVVVTGTLLTLIMIVLSAGYYIGGTLERLRSLRTLCFVLVGACVYTQLANVILLDRIGDLGLEFRDHLGGLDHLEVALPATLLSILLYGPPVLALSTISPCLIRIISDRPDSVAGRQAGLIMSLSTAGSIFGTLLASYVLIPSLGVRTTAAGSNLLLFVVLMFTLVYTARNGRGRMVAAAAAGVILLALLPVARSQYEPNVLEDSESLYGRVRVVSEVDESGRPFLAYQSTRSYWHSVVYPQEPLRELPGSFYLAPAVLENSKTMLILGSAAGGIARQAQVLLPSLQMTGVDIDPAVHDVATKHFGVDASKMRLVTRDARQFLEREEGTYDFIIVDTFAGEFMPAHCITREFFARVKERLNPGGVVFINTNMYDVPFELPKGEREPARAYRHLQQTLREAGFPSVFENKYFHSSVAYPTPVSFDTFRDKLLAAAADPKWPAATRAALGFMAQTTVDSERHPKRYEAFTDAWAPEMLLELKSNHGRLYKALADAEPGEADLHPVARIVRERMTAERATGNTSGAIADAGALIAALNRLPTPLTAADERLAARYFRFDYGDLPALEARTPWAKRAAHYARMYDAAYDNDYEKLSKVLVEPN